MGEIKPGSVSTDELASFLGTTNNFSPADTQLAALLSHRRNGRDCGGRSLSRCGSWGDDKCGSC